MAKKKKTKGKKGAKAVKKVKPVRKSKPKAGFVKKKKKRWFEIIAPKEFRSRKVGETLAVEPNEVVGRKLRLNLSSLVDEFRRQGVNVQFKVVSVTDNSAVCETVGYGLVRSYVRRIVRKGSSKMDDSFVVVSKDSKKFKIKPIVVTKHKINDSSLTSLRKKASEFIVQKVGELNSVEVFEAVVRGKLQKELRSGLMKICPIGACEVRALEML